ncbi:YfcL family protein [Aestuariibacter sp. A3R04]|uniref:YfcL family protein n=1 Tax=Aestuariibacter sp. A3R04 TaxID=2841571 RepID=UPI001C09EF9F|nr:YfcL family protein [Aestuariibacter sp. A3R04]MBU3023312.1 YfcL family protein [Aestuariibacter sp. A3R04]
MHYPAAATSAFIHSIGKIEAALDSVVDQGSDDELFIASYLQGHFAVVARQLEMDPDASIASLDEAMRGSLTSAFDNQELDEADQQSVILLWQHLLSSAKQD